MDTTNHPEAEDTLQPATPSALPPVSRWPALAQRRAVPAVGSAADDQAAEPPTVYVPPTRFHAADEASVAQEPAAGPDAGQPALAQTAAPPPVPSLPAFADEPIAGIFARLRGYADDGRPDPQAMPALFRRLLRN
ncbi:hypothetical protein N5K27_06970 [Pigmentiphaga sp. GD03639]|uniref:Uncharacterized protein n=1 Tax=Pigmentiphaga daeguensis TaxID=414049 RepID=A0ABN1CX35_9BURK|nr:hypothetical protein [Pigmentiphaga sp. GD03639]MDH2236036.1 hypothetical protein [Pigmentiphaga sp. GD03639]